MPQQAPTSEQRSVIEAGPAERLLVTAGPGTGKTYVLVRRLEHLVCDQRLSAGSELLVLSFSRAAVREIRRRTGEADDSVRYVRALTFDSFATRLLAAGPMLAEQWQALDYEGRIKAAVRLLHEDEATRAQLASYRHVLVDELQDCVGERAQLLIAILDAVDCGFTLLGDPAQGIYNFQLKNRAGRALDSEGLYECVRSRYTPAFRAVSLTENHRATTAAARIALWAGAEMNGPAPDYADIRTRLENAVLQLPFLGASDCDRSLAYLRLAQGPVAVLCRDNGQALAVSRALWSKGVSHTLQRDATDRAIAPWVAAALGALDGTRAGKTAFMARYRALFPSASDDESCWRLLKRVEGNRLDVMDLLVVAERLRTGNMPDELCSPTAERVVVSTVHRAKGLEFDKVLLLDPRPRLLADADLPEETRVLYVALTRPREAIFRVGAPSTCALPFQRKRSRWHLPGAPRLLEVQGRDADDQVPAGGAGDAVDIQAYIRESVLVGDPVVLTRQLVSPAGTLARYSIEHEGRLVGHTNEAFGRVVQQHFRLPWPVRIGDLRVEAIDSVVGDVAAAAQVGLGATPFWLRVRPCGLGTLG